MTAQSEVLPLRRVLLRHARDAFESDARIAEQWRALGYLAPPAFDEACRESDAFAALLTSLGVVVEWMDARALGGVGPDSDGGGAVVDREGGHALGLDSLYVRDASFETRAGTVLCRMGKEARAGEPGAHERALTAIGRTIAGRIEAPGTLEGGDVAWLDERTLAVGRGYRTNEEGIRQLRELLDDVEVISVPVPHWKGPGDVFHLMSILSPLAPDGLLVYSPLMPVPFRELLLGRGFRLVEVPPEEFESQACNVLAVAPGVAVTLEGNPETRRRMEAAGVEVHTFAGREISVKGCGGPTCLTHPLERG